MKGSRIETAPRVSETRGAATRSICCKVKSREKEEKSILEEIKHISFTRGVK